jgi:hypothetical protein
MPELSRFFGIVIQMFTEKGGKHHVPHFHVRYGENKAALSIPELEIIAGTLPNKQRRLVEAWAEIHMEELLNDWKLLSGGENPKKIEPLR